jgi:type 1 fimbria pilin
MFSYIDLKRKIRVGFLKVAALTAIVPFMMTSAQAGVADCNATVASISVSPGGTVTVLLPGFGYAYMCNVNTPHPTSTGNISVDICKIWVAQFMNAAAQGKRFQFIIDYGAQPAPNCSAISGWNWAIPNPFPYWVNFPQ